MGILGSAGAFFSGLTGIGGSRGTGSSSGSALRALIGVGGTIANLALGGSKPKTQALLAAVTGAPVFATGEVRALGPPSGIPAAAFMADPEPIPAVGGRFLPGRSFPTRGDVRLAGVGGEPVGLIGSGLDLQSIAAGGPSGFAGAPGAGGAGFFGTAGNILLQGGAALAGGFLAERFGGGGGGAPAVAPAAAVSGLTTAAPERLFPRQPFFRPSMAAPRAVPMRLIAVPNPLTGDINYWRHVGKPILFSGDPGLVRRIKRDAARALRGISSHGSHRRSTRPFA